MNTENWMKNVDGEKPLSMINIPGTHDSATKYVTSIVPKCFCCQDTTVKEQLLLGARFIDARLVYRHKRFKFVHYITNCRKNKSLGSELLHFEDVFSDISDFLKDNPSETVILSVKMDFGTNIDEFYTEFYNTYIAENQDLWYLENKIPTLSEVRGKIVFARRCVLGSSDFTSDSNGIDFSYWENQSSCKSLLPLLCWFGNEPNEKAVIQDRFKLKKEEKWSSAILTMINDYHPHNNIMALNFLSTAGNPRENAKYINDEFTNYVLPKKPLGIVIFDFITKPLAEKVISTNFEGVTDGTDI